nr:uncharacterized protein LOC129282693 [Lytechinus pictus]
MDSVLHRLKALDALESYVEYLTAKIEQLTSERSTIQEPKKGNPKGLPESAKNQTSSMDLKKPSMLVQSTPDQSVCCHGNENPGPFEPKTLLNESVSNTSEQNQGNDLGSEERVRPRSQYSQGKVKVAFRLIDYSNPSHHELDGGCCDQVLLSCGSCDNRFNLCFDEYGGNNNMAQCDYGNYETNLLYEHNDDFNFPGSLNDNLLNPFILTINQWSTGFRSKIEVWDFDPFNSDDKIDYYGKNYNYVPARTSALATEHIVTLNGAGTSQTNVGVKVYCDVHYYGTSSGCSTYCLPRDNHQGHYDCNDITGARMCHAGWTGSYCQIVRSRQPPFDSDLPHIFICNWPKDPELGQAAPTLPAKSKLGACALSSKPKDIADDFEKENPYATGGYLHHQIFKELIRRRSFLQDNDVPRTMSSAVSPSPTDNDPSYSFNIYTSDEDPLTLNETPNPLSQGGEANPNEVDEQPPTPTTGPTTPSSPNDPYATTVLHEENSQSIA